MEIKRDKSLKLFFLQFLGKTLLYVLVGLVIWLIGLTLIIGNGKGIIPANQTEEQIKQWENKCEESGTYDFNEFPELAGYVLFVDDEIQSSGHMSDQEIQKSVELLHSGEFQMRGLFDSEQYVKLEQNGQVCVIKYAIRAEFANETLRKIIPSVEFLLVILLVVNILAAVTLSILQTSKKMSREVLSLKKASEEIQDQNLDFTIQPGKIKEFNAVLKALDDLKQNLSTSLEKQWKLEQEKKQQMSALAHDIKTPLTIINGNAELLLESELDEEQTQFTKSIYQSTDQIQKYVKQIIDLSKDHILTVEPKSCQTVDLIEDYYETAVNLSLSKKIRIEQHVEENLPGNIITDAEALHRAYLNLIDNAIRFTPENAVVTLKFHMDQQQQYLCFGVEDSGPGFSNEALSCAKQQFYQADESRTSREHFGMGLFIADQIVTNLKGQLLIENSPKGGGSVTIRIPVSEQIK